LSTLPKTATAICGLPPGTAVSAAAEQAQLFDAFVQTQSGSGLGLAISQQFAQLMGGQLSVSSQLGQGSTFRLDLPVVQAEAAEVTQAPRAVRRVVALAAGQPAWRVLIVEDGEDNRRLLRQVLEPLGFQVREAVDGQQGIEQWREWRPQLIWMDMRMPVLDGYEATRQIRASSGSESTVIIALTASAFEEDRRKVLDAGCDDFVRKPFREEELFEVMREHLGVRYVYEESAQPAAQSGLPTSSGLYAAALAELPAEFLAQLQQAAAQADDELVLALLDQLAGDHDELAKS
jgi:CheY-like chemotaxis protein